MRDSQLRYSPLVVLNITDKEQKVNIQIIDYIFKKV